MSCHPIHASGNTRHIHVRACVGSAVSSNGEVDGARRQRTPRPKLLATNNVWRQHNASVHRR